MKKTVCELFAGVGGFRCGLNHIKTVEDTKKPEKWETVWFNQWEPAEKKTQYAHDCYVYRFGTRLDQNGKDTTNVDIEEVDKTAIPDFNLLVGGFPCQDYSVASSLATSKGLEGKKGILWWSIRDTIEAKEPPFVLLENVDRLLKSPAKQRGRDFGIILACFRDQGYTVEWRVINAADYGYQQRRRRTFIFAYRDDTKYCSTIKKEVGYTRTAEIEDRRISMGKLLLKDGFFAKTFPVYEMDVNKMAIQELPEGIGELSDSFSFGFENTGVMKDGVIYTLKTSPKYDGPQITLGDIMETGEVDEAYFIPEERLYYTDPGAIEMLDSYDKPARTMLTSEGSFSRTTHIVKDKKTGRIRLLTAAETERIQGFPTDHTKYCLIDGDVVEMPVNKRRFMMGNALVVNLIENMEETLSNIFEEEDN